jgi:hypothetical protein
VRARRGRRPYDYRNAPSRLRTPVLQLRESSRANRPAERLHRGFREASDSASRCCVLSRLAPPLPSRKRGGMGPGPGSGASGARPTPHAHAHARRYPPPSSAGRVGAWSLACASVRKCSLSAARSATSLARPPSQRPSGACRSCARGQIRAFRTSTERRGRESRQERSLRPPGSPPRYRRRDPR